MANVAVAPRHDDDARDTRATVDDDALRGKPALSLGESSTGCVARTARRSRRSIARAGSIGRFTCALKLLGLFGAKQPEPEEVVRAERQQIRQVADARETVLAPQLERNMPVELAQIELHELREARQVVDAEDRLVAIAPQKHEHATIRRVDGFPRAATERLVLLPHAR